MAVDEIGRVFFGGEPEMDRSGHYALQANLVDAAHAATQGESPRLDEEGAQSAEAIVISRARTLSLDGFLQRAPQHAIRPGEQ